MTDKTLRILQVVSGMNRGGVETWLMTVFRHLDRKRFHMDFLVHTKQECAYDAEIRQMGSRVIPCLHPSKPWQYTLHFRKIVQQYGPYDVIHSHVYWFSGYIMCLSAHMGIPKRLVHVYPQQDASRGKAMRDVYRHLMGYLISRYATSILACSQSSLSAFGEKVDLSRLPHSVIYPIVDLSPYMRPIDRATVREQYGLPQELPLILYVARFFPHKNHRGLLTIAQQVNDRETIAHFVLAGAHGPTVSELQFASKTRSDISVLVDVPEISELMKSCDLFVFPSLDEGFGIVAIEAQAAGLPVIATDLDSVREALAPALQPLMFRPHELSKAASHIKMLLLDRSRMKQLGQEARAWVISKFSAQDSITKLLNFYTTDPQNLIIEEN